MKHPDPVFSFLPSPLIACSALDIRLAHAVEAMNKLSNFFTPWSLVFHALTVGFFYIFYVTQKFI